MNKLKALLFGVATCAVCLAASAGSKYALAVGVNAYLDDWQSGLSGCVTDARHMTDVLVNCGGWPANSVCQLVDEKATVANVRSAFKDLAGRVRSGDTVVVYWSSHGGYIYSSKTGTDKSSLCAYDAEYTDKMLAEDLGRFLSGVKVVVVIDTCCSGGLFQTATVGGNAKAADSTFAQRVDALLSRSKAGGIAASEVGWMTAVAYNQSSMDASQSIGACYTGNCLVYDGIYWGKADTDKDGDISFLDLHNHARKWFSEDAEWARYEACFGTISAEKKDALRKKMQKFSPQMLHEDVLASVLVRDRAVAGGNKYPFKVEFYTLCNGALDSLITKGDVQFVWPGESAVEPTLVSDNDYAFVGWDTDFTDVRKDLIVRGTYVEMSAAETFIEVAETVKKFVGFTLAECEDPQTSNIYQYVTATFDGVYAKGGRLTVTLTGVDGTKDKFSGQLDDVSFEGFFMAELTSSKSDDTIVIKMSTSAVYGTYRHGDAEYSIEGNWDWVSTRETLAQAVRERYAAVYNVGMEVDFFFGGREGLSNEVGYVNVVLSEQNGKAKVTGVLGDGTTIPSMGRSRARTG